MILTVSTVSSFLENGYLLIYCLKQWCETSFDIQLLFANLGVANALPCYTAGNAKWATNLNPALFTKFVGKGVSGSEHSLNSPLTSICVGHQKGDLTMIFPFDPIMMPSFGKFASKIEKKFSC